MVSTHTSQLRLVEDFLPAVAAGLVPAAVAVGVVGVAVALVAASLRPGPSTFSDVMDARSLPWT